MCCTVSSPVFATQTPLGPAAIAPGWFPTEMSGSTIEAGRDAFLRRIPLGRFGGPDDLKGTVVFLASAASNYVTGTTVLVDGGQSAS